MNIEFVGRAWQWFGDEPHQRQGIRLVELAIGAVLLFRVFTEARFSSYLWGPKGVGTGTTQSTLGHWLGARVDVVFHTQTGIDILLLALGIAAIYLILGIQTRLAIIVAAFLFFLVLVRAPEIGDGGDNIIQLVLIYLVFALPTGAPAPPRQSMRVWLHNGAVVAVALQVMVLYGTSGLSKAFGTEWHNGTAMYYISQVQWFSIPIARGLFRNPTVATVSAYAPVLYQVMFPVAMLSRLKLPWLLTGVLFHLSIAVFMGLVTFALAMIGMELFMITDHEYAQLGRVADSLRVKLVSRASAHFPRLRSSRPTLGDGS